MDLGAGKISESGFHPGCGWQSRIQARLGLPLPEYALRLLAGGRAPGPAPRTGAELLAYWEGEGLFGTRPDIVDSPAHARTLREQAQRRARP